MEEVSREAIERVSRFVQCWDEKPLKGIDDEVYGIHTGTEWEASIRVSDLRALVAALSGPRTPVEEVSMREALEQIRAAVSKRQLPITNQVYELADAALSAAQVRDDGWLPIESAPTGARVDLWVGGERVPNCLLDADGDWLFRSTTEFADMPLISFYGEPTKWRPLPPALL